MGRRTFDLQTASAEVVESVIHRPSGWLFLTVGTLFSGLGIWFFATPGSQFPSGWPLLIYRLFASIFAAFGGVVLLVGLNAALFPKRVKHAPLSLLPGIPTEPVIRQGLIVQHRLIHELLEFDDGWELRVDSKHGQNAKRIIIAFGIFCMIPSWAVWSWIFHREAEFTWTWAVLLAGVMVYVVGGITLSLMTLVIGASYKRLTELSYSAAHEELSLVSAPEPKLGNDKVAAALKWFLSEDDVRQHLKIPRDHVIAVQLCPWKYVLGSRFNRDITWAVQGVLVLASGEDGTYHRLPLLLTSDFVRTARLMGRLAEKLDVPYLFCADAAGWVTESARARTRAPLEIGGM